MDEVVMTELESKTQDCTRFLHGLVEIAEAGDDVPAAVLRSVADDIANRGMQPRMAAYQIRLRTGHGIPDESAGRMLPRNETPRAEIGRALTDALSDMLAGWRYIRKVHGDLAGVGWDRAQEKAEQALALLNDDGGRTPPSAENTREEIGPVVDFKHAPVDLKFGYRNWSGKVGARRVMPISIRYGAPKWHPAPQWLMLAYDFDKSDQREFAMKDMAGVWPATAISVEAHHAA